MAVVVTVEDGSGVPGANSYGDVAGADAYLGARPRASGWTALTPDAKAQHLVHATRILDASVLWTGERVSLTQSLQFPRVIEGENVGVPPIIEAALYELALALITTDLTSPSTTTGLKSIKVGPIEIENEGTMQPATIPRFVRDLIAPYGSARSAVGMAQLIRR